MLKNWRVYWRLSALIVSMLSYLSIIIGRQIFLGQNEPHALRIRQRWTTMALKILGLRVQVQGTIPEHHGLVVSNHKCLIDPVIILSKMVVIPVGKAEIAGYPLVGKAAEITGILFLDRKNKESHQATRDGIRRFLQKERSILIFPEGTTFSKPGIRDFKKGSFEIAAEEKVAVIPLAIDYAHQDLIWHEGDSTWSHFKRAFQHRSTQITLHIGSAIKNDQSAELLTSARTFILNALGQSGDDKNLSKP